MTGLYNVLEALRAGRPLTAAERDIHDAGQVSILRRLHDDLDAAVADAYGWPADLSAPAVVARVVALNAARLAEEAGGEIRWLRPAYQAPNEAPRAQQAVLDVAEAEDATLPPWPSAEADRYMALRSLLATTPGHPIDFTRRFKRAPGAKVRHARDPGRAGPGQARPGWPLPELKTRRSHK